MTYRMSIPVHTPTTNESRVALFSPLVSSKQEVTYTSVMQGDVLGDVIVDGGRVDGTVRPTGHGGGVYLQQERG